MSANSFIIWKNISAFTQASFKRIKDPVFFKHQNDVELTERVHLTSSLTLRDIGRKQYGLNWPIQWRYQQEHGNSLSIFFGERNLHWTSVFWIIIWCWHVRRIDDLGPIWYGTQSLQVWYSHFRIGTPHVFRTNAIWSCMDPGVKKPSNVAGLRDSLVNLSTIQTSRARKTPAKCIHRARHNTTSAMRRGSFCESNGRNLYFARVRKKM